MRYFFMFHIGFSMVSQEGDDFKRRISPTSTLTMGIDSDRFEFSSNDFSRSISPLSTNQEDSDCFHYSEPRRINLWSTNLFPKMKPVEDPLKVHVEKPMEDFLVDFLYLKPSSIWYHEDGNFAFEIQSRLYHQTFVSFSDINTYTVLNYI